MPRKAATQPTDVELAILGVLWNRGASTVREVHDALSEERSTGYSTTLKMMQVMLEKGLLKRDESERPQRYRPAKSQQKTQQKLVNHLVHKAFGGAAGRLLVQALTETEVSDDELAEIKALIRKIEERRS